MNIVERFMKRTELRKLRQANKQLNVVITGGSRGLGSSLCNRFLSHGDRVTIICRNPTGSMHRDNLRIIEKDVMDVTHDLFNHKVDLWINNAAVSGGYKKFIDQPNDKIVEILQTNLVATTLCSKLAFDIMSSHPDGGAIYNMTGAGANGLPTSNYSLYGASKAGLLQLTKSLQEEWKDSNIDLHTVSPGMMKTELLLENLPSSINKIVSYFCTDPDIVADWLVTAMRNTYYDADDNSYINYMTLMRLIKRLNLRVSDQ